MKYLNLLSLFLFFLFTTGAQGQVNYIKTHKLPQGKFVSVADSLEVIVIKGDSTLDYYEHEFLGSAKYFFTDESCESSYKPAYKKPTFLIWRPYGLCYEVDGITDDYIELIYTLTGRTLTYHKVK
ncbi:MAG TPA: hypothetical protein VG738_10930 [Chitinophagaceae bacterium]|nr:hypothetical protein [Chitinophagaceae bacterium]